MGIKHMSYLDIPPEDRRDVAANIRRRIREQLVNPFIPREQSAALLVQLEASSQWEEGTLHIGSSDTLPVPAPAQLEAPPRVLPLVLAPEPLALLPPKEPAIDAHEDIVDEAHDPTHHTIEVSDSAEVKDS